VTTADNRIVLASSNPGKLAEIRELLADLPYNLVAQGELGITEIPETGFTFVENALLKARNASRLSGLPALSDDSGLLVDVLNGAPGLKSARYAGEKATPDSNNIKLLDALKGVAPLQRTAQFYCVIVFLRHARDPAPLICQGVWHGRILEEPRGTGGFGYDSLFLEPGLEQSAAEMEAAMKNLVSHRSRALADLRSGLARR